MALTQEQLNELHQKYTPKPKSGVTQSRLDRLKAIADQRKKEEGVISQEQTSQGLFGQLKENPFSVLTDIGKGFFKGVGSTISGAASAGEKLLRGTTKALLPESVEQAIGINDDEFVTGAEQIIPQESFKPKSTAEKIGFYGEQIAEFLIPGSAATKVGRATGKAGRLAGLAGRVGAEVVEGAGITALQTGGDISEMERDAYFSAALPIFGATAKGIKQAITPSKGVLATTGEILTGVPGEKINKWYDLAQKTPKRIENAKQIITQNPSNPFMELTQAVGNSLKGLKDAAKKAFDDAVKVSRSKYADKTFDLGNKIPDLNTTLNKFNLKVAPMKATGNSLIEKIRSAEKVVVSPTTRTSPFSKKELDQLSNIIEKARIPNLSVDELLDFDASVKNLLEDFVRKDNKKMIALGSELLENSTKFIDEALPEVDKANQMYRSYYNAMDNGGRKILSAQGDIKPSAENYIKNITNKNKGLQQKEIKKMEKALGINILNNVEDVKLASEMLSTVPMTTRNRTIDFLRGAISSNVFAGGAAVGTTINPVIAVPALLVNVLSSPKVYSNIVEYLAGKTKKLPIEKLNNAERELLNNILQGIFAKTTTTEE